MIQESTLDTGGVVINYAAVGTGSAPLLLLHGLSFRWQSWLPLMAPLARSRRVYALDLRGHGRSGRAPGGYDFDGFVDDAVSFVERVVGEPTALFGHSLGGAVALAAAARLGGMATALVIGDNCVYRESQLALLEGSHLPALFTAISDLAARGGTAEEAAAALADLRVPVAGLELRLGDLPGNDLAFLREWGGGVARLDPEAVDILLGERHSRSYDAEAYLGRLSSKLMLLQGDPTCGGVMPDRDVRRALLAAPAASHVRLEGVGHMLHMHQPRLVLEALEGFLGPA